MRASSYTDIDGLSVGGIAVPHARTFRTVAVGSPFWHENSHGLIEIAVNHDCASEQLGVGVCGLIEIQ